jgi:hypothetical protein
LQKEIEDSVVLSVRRLSDAEENKTSEHKAATDLPVQSTVDAKKHAQPTKDVAKPVDVGQDTKKSAKPDEKQKKAQPTADNAMSKQLA